MNRRAARYLPVLVAAVVGCAGASWAASDDATLLLGRRQRGPILTLDPFAGSVEFETFASSTSTSSGGQKSTATDLTFREMLNIGTSGAVISRPFLSWHAAVGVGMTEEWTSSGTQNESSYGIVDTFNIGATALNATQFPVGLYAQRGQSYIAQAFQSMLQQTRTDIGGTAAYQSAVLPTKVRVSHSETDQTTLAGQAKYHLTEDRLDLEARYRPNGRHEATLNYQYASVDDGTTGEFATNYKSNDLSIVDDWTLDGDSRYRLMSSFRYSDQVGTSPYAHISLDENLQMQHTDNFNTYLQYGLEKEDAVTSLTTNRFLGGFTHRLYESLVTNGTASYVMTDNSGGGSVSQWAATLGTNYTKKVPLGVFSANINGSLSVSDSTGSQSPVQIVNQTQTFNDTLPVILPQQNIDPATVVVYDSTHTRRLVEGTDYRKTVVNRQVQLTWLPGSYVGSTDSVLVNYTVLPTPDTRTTTTAIGGGARYEFQEGLFKGLGLYGRVYMQDQAVECAIPDFITPDHIRDYSIGADYQVWKLTLVAEQEWHQSTLSPYDLTRFTARYTDRLGDRTRLSLTARQTYTNFETDRSDVTSVDGRFTYDITQNLKASINAAWRNENNSAYGRTQAFEQNAELRWEIRQTNIYMRLRNTMLDTAGNENQSLFFQFGFQRRF